MDFSIFIPCSSSPHKMPENKGISGAEPALQLLHAAQLDALGDRKALLNLPRELRQLIKKNEE